MGTSRTGTSRWKRLRALTIAEAHRAGQTTCPLCGVKLVWKHDTANRASAEVDHIVTHRRGGADDEANVRVICRGCNTARNRKHSAAPMNATTTLLAW